MASSATPHLPVKIRLLLGDVHSIAKTKDILTKHGKSLELNGWYIDSDLRKRRQKLEVKILTILKEFQPQMEHHNWVKFIETTDTGHTVLMQHIDILYTQMHAINEEYDKYSTFLNKAENAETELEEKRKTLTSAFVHMKFTEKNLHYLAGDDYESHRLRGVMHWNGWK